MNFYLAYSIAHPSVLSQDLAPCSAPQAHGSLTSQKSGGVKKDTEDFHLSYETEQQGHEIWSGFSH